ncbi:MAG: branched-chain amino acid ABC transporter substrate-binding protein [Elusimicrobia bacterium]|nr:branched-chain amino acid ABC transporter substrate-binding protein [Elusimicrobiota bacterium]
MRSRLSLALAAALGVLAWAGPSACNRVKPIVRIAVTGPLTGDLAPEGLGMQRSVEMAVADSEAGGESLWRFEVAPYDDRAEPETAALVAGRIVADPAVAVVVGHITSGCSIAAAKVYAAAGLTMITPSATSPEVTLQQTRPDWTDPRVALRIPASDAVLGAYAADYAYDRFDLRRMAVVEDGTPYGRDLTAAFRRRFEAKGGVTVPSRSVSRGQRDFTALLSELQALRPDGLFFGGIYTEFGQLLKAARGLGVPWPFLGGDGAKAPELFAVAGPAADGAYLAVSGVPVEDIPSAADFVENYRKRYGGMPRVFDHYAYEAGLIAVECLRHHGSDRPAVLDCIRNSRHSGMLGTIVFDAKGDTLKSVITMTRADAKQKRFVPIY